LETQSTADIQSGGYSHGRRKYLRRRGKEEKNGAARRAEHRKSLRCITADLMWGKGIIITLARAKEGGGCKGEENFGV